ncbi:carbohydrate ABC transporter substrate-binding protein [Streptacidiphilus sp. PB12-B1b]|uniref:ABC transporter substrate-binding protein n=1 Tax=Streptacidiphilus sp. PB12-B1b TaxID=2705012 RepID=UPI0015F79572|nr:ABC transporter substrate-binding protein [Streptacidiphilus sp. PB12-B1b]QMU76500.1 carbohydrate ABC transporter substrate-binding protein [Streptacidiphilus sp. PB12-B1b]
MTHTPLPDRPVSRRGVLAGFGVLGVLGALGVAGCSTTTPGGGSAKGAATETDSIKFYGNALGEDAQKAAWQAVVNGWEKQSGKTVKPVVFPYDQASTQLALAAKSGDFDGVGQGPWQVLVPTGILADVSDLARTMNLPGKIVDSFLINGKLYFIPVNASGIGMVCDGRVADEVGLKDAMSVEDFAAALEKIKAQDPKVIPYAAVTENPDLKDAVHWMWGWGSEVVTDNLQCTIGDAASVAAMTWYKGLQDAGLVKGGVDRSDARILFAQGQAAIYDDAPLADSFVKTNGGSAALQAAIRPLQRPVFQANPSYNRFWGSGLFCSAGEGEATSKDFIDYVATNVSAATELYKESSLAPADATVAARVPGLDKDPFQSAFRTAVADHARASAWDKLASSAEIDTAIGQGVAGILAGQTGVQNGLNALRKNVQSILSQNN